MDDGKLTAVCTATGVLGGLATSATGEVVIYAALSALTAYLTKHALDRLFTKVVKNFGKP